MLAALANHASAITMTLQTTGTGASAVANNDGTVTLTTTDGSQGIAYLHLDIPGGIALKDISSLSYSAKILTPGSGGFAPEIMLNIDADNDGVFFGSGTKFFAGYHDPAELGGDNFLSGDSANSYTTAEGAFTSRDAIGTEYRYFSANDDRTGNTNLFYTQFSNVLNNVLPLHDIDDTDLVFSIDILVGSSTNFNGMSAMFDAGVELNGVVYDLPQAVSLAGDSFNSGQSLATLGFTTNFAATGGVSIIQDPYGITGDGVLELQDAVGDPVSASFDALIENEFSLVFDYSFQTDGKLELYLDDLLLDSIINEDGSFADYVHYDRAFSLESLGLAPGTYTISLVLSNVGDPILLIDELFVNAPSVNVNQVGETSATPEPVTATLSLAALAALAVGIRRRR
jgi:uncharacterized protein (TIGR03382 family)